MQRQAPQTFTLSPLKVLSLLAKQQGPSKLKCNILDTLILRPSSEVFTKVPSSSCSQIFASWIYTDLNGLVKEKESNLCKN